MNSFQTTSKPFQALPFASKFAIQSLKTFANELEIEDHGFQGR